jgi:glycosyltransferase involved in cell wall biosynthesis
MLITILITTYNRKVLLERAISSVEKQSFKDYEILIVDDNSSDGTVEYLKQRKNIRYILKDENRGLVDSRNIGWRDAKGKYIAFLDDDDFWLDENKLSKQVRELNDKKLIFCSAVKTEHQILTKKIPSDWKKRIIYRNGFIHTSTVILKKDALELCGGFDPKLKRGIDSDLYRILIHKYDFAICHIDEALVWYELNSANRITQKVDRYQRWCQLIHLAFKYKFLILSHPIEYIRRQIISIKHII